MVSLHVPRRRSERRSLLVSAVTSPSRTSPAIDRSFWGELLAPSTTSSSSSRTLVIFSSTSPTVFVTGARAAPLPAPSCDGPWPYNTRARWAGSSPVTIETRLSSPQPSRGRPREGGATCAGATRPSLRAIGPSSLARSVSRSGSGRFTPVPFPLHRLGPCRAKRTFWIVHRDERLWAMISVPLAEHP